MNISSSLHPLNVMLLLFLSIMLSCSEKLPSVEILENTKSGAILRMIPFSNGTFDKNELDVSDPQSTLQLVFEAQDANDGKNINRVEVRVALSSLDNPEDDSKSTATGTEEKRELVFTALREIPRSEFNKTTDTNTHELPVHEFTVTLAQLSAVFPDKTIDYWSTFAFAFDIVMNDGTRYTPDDVANSVKRIAGYYKSPLELTFSANFKLPKINRVSHLPAYGQESFELGGGLVFARHASYRNGFGNLVSASIEVSTGTPDMVKLYFNAPAAGLTTNPTIQVKHGALDGTGAVETIPATDIKNQTTNNNYSYTYFAYAPSNEPSDSISFIISGAQAAGATMLTDTLKYFYTIDNVLTASIDATSLTKTIEGGMVTGGSFTILFSSEALRVVKDGDGEAVKTIRYRISPRTAGTFADVDGGLVVEEGREKREDYPVTFKLATPIADMGQIPIEVWVAGVKDEAGNVLNIRIQLDW